MIKLPFVSCFAACTALCLSVMSTTIMADGYSSQVISENEFIDLSTDPQVSSLDIELLAIKYGVYNEISSSDSELLECNKTVDTVWEGINDFLLAVPGVGTAAKLFGALSKTVNNIKCKKDDSTVSYTLEEITNISTVAAQVVYDQEAIKDITLAINYIAESLNSHILLFNELELVIEQEGLTPELKDEMLTLYNALYASYLDLGIEESLIESRIYEASSLAVIAGALKLGVLKSAISINEKYLNQPFTLLYLKDLLNTEAVQSYDIAMVISADLEAYLNSIKADNYSFYSLNWRTSEADYEVRWLDRNNKELYKKDLYCWKVVFIVGGSCPKIASTYNSMVTAANTWLASYKSDVKSNVLSDEFMNYLTMLDFTKNHDFNGEYQPIQSGVTGRCLTFNSSYESVSTYCDMLQPEFLWATDLNGTGQIKNKANGMCLSIGGGDASNGTLVMLEDCNVLELAQKWESSVFLSIKPAIDSTKCLDVDFSNGGTEDVVSILTWGCHHGINQQWIF